MLGVKRAKDFADGAILVLARYRKQHAFGMVAERGGECDLLLGGGPRRGNIRCAEMFDEPLGQQLDRCRTVGFAGLHDLNQSRPAERVRCRGSPTGRPRAPCLRARRHPDARTQRHPAPPTRQAPRPDRTRMYRRDRAGWCAAASCLGPPVDGSSQDGVASAAREHVPVRAPAGRATASADRPCRRAQASRPSRRFRCSR